MQDAKKSPKIRRVGTIELLCRAIYSQLRCVSTIGKKLVKQQYLPTCSHNMVNFSLLAAEIVSLVWGTPAHFNGFRVASWQLYCTTLQYWASAKLCGVEQRAAPNIFGRAAVMLGIGPHSNFVLFLLSFFLFFLA